MLDSMLFLTRKFPPKTGGMENMCYNLFKGFKAKISNLKLVALGRGQINLIWFFPYTVLYTILFARKYQALLIGDSLLCFTGIVSKIFVPKTKRVIIVYGLDILFDNVLYQLYLKLFLKRSADIFVCISAETQKLLRQRGIENTIVITPGIDIEETSSEDAAARQELMTKHNFADEYLILVTVGRLVRRKGVAWFVCNVMPKLKDKNVIYFVVGAGGDEHSIREAIKESELQRQVKLLGRVSDAELKELYQGADVFVMPNIVVPNDMEGFGIVALEASLAKLVVLASGIEGITDAVIDGKNGFLMESENAACYEQKILEILKNREEYKTIANNFAEYTKSHYSWDYICNQYVEAICKFEKPTSIPGIA